MTCVYEDCDNQPEFYDQMDDMVCRSCMERDIKNSGFEPDDYTPLDGPS